jgi:hypothetical protein
MTPDSWLVVGLLAASALLMLLSGFASAMRYASPPYPRREDSVNDEAIFRTVKSARRG